jgi:hypothetical protein
MKLMSLMFDVPDEETLVNVGIALNHCLPGYTKNLSEAVLQRLVLVWLLLIECLFSRIRRCCSSVNQILGNFMM